MILQIADSVCSLCCVHKAQVRSFKSHDFAPDILVQALNHALNLALIAPPTQNEVGPRSDFRIADFKGCVLLPLLLLLFE